MGMPGSAPPSNGKRLPPTIVNLPGGGIKIIPGAPVSGGASPLVKPLPDQNKLKSNAATSAGNVGTILTSPIGVGDDNYSSTTLLGT